MAENRAARSMTASRKEEELLDMEIKTKVVVAWIEGLLGEKLPNQPLREVLHDGVVLCKLANVMKPGCIRKFHRRPKMLMMKMENIAFFLNVAKTRFNVQPTVLFSPTDVHDESSPTSLLKVLRVLLLLRNECPGNAVIDEDLLKALASSSIETDAAEPEPEPEPAAEPEPTPEPEPEPTPEDDEDAEMLEAEKMAQEAAEAAKRALEAAKAAQERAKAAAQERAAAAAAERERVAAEKAAAEKAALERAAAEKAAAEKAAADKAAAERAAADKAAADALAAEKSAMQAAASAKAAAEKAAADKAAADHRANTERAAAEKLAAEKLAAQKRAQAAHAPAASTPVAATNGAKSAASSLNGVAVQEQVLEEVVKCIHSELSVESKHELRSALQSYLEPIQQQLMYSSDKDLRVLCKEMGLADVPENKERKWYVDWILHQGRSSS